MSSLFHWTVSVCFTNTRLIGNPFIMEYDSSFLFRAKVLTLTLDSTHLQKWTFWLLIYLTKTVYGVDTPQTYNIKKPTIDHPASSLHWNTLVGIFCFRTLMNRRISGMPIYTYHTLFSYSSFCHLYLQIAKARRGGQRTGREERLLQS